MSSSVGLAPPLNKLHKDFHLLYLSSHDSRLQAEYSLLRRYEIWSIVKNSVKNKLSKTQILRLNPFQVSVSEPSLTLAKVYERNPVGERHLFSSSTILGSEKSFVVFGDVLGLLTIRNLSTSENKCLRYFSEPIFGLSQSSKLLALKHRNCVRLLKSSCNYSLVSELYFPSGDLTDVFLDDSSEQLLTTSTTGVLRLTNIETSQVEREIVIECNTDNNWSQIIKSFIGTRRQISFFDSRSRIVSPLISSSGPIGGFAQCTKYKMMIVTKDELLLYDLRNTKKEYLTESHYCFELPGGLSVTEPLIDDVSYVSIYTPSGNLSILAFDSSFTTRRGHIRHFEPLSELLNSCSLESTSEMRVVLPWSGIISLSNEAKTNCSVITVNSLGDLYSIKYTKGEYTTTQDWLLQSPTTFSLDDKSFPNYQSIKYSLASRVYRRPYHHFDLKRSFPKIAKKKKSTKEKSNNDETKKKTHKKKLKKKDKQNSFTNLPQLISSFGAFKDKESQNVLEILNHGALTSFSEPCVSDSDSRSYFLSQESIILPTSSTQESGMIQQFMRDLEREPHCTSTQEDFDERLQSSFSSCVPLFEPLKRKKKRKIQAGF